jgi:hypothetical protein
MKTPGAVFWPRPGGLGGMCHGCVVCQNGTQSQTRAEDSSMKGSTLGAVVLGMDDPALRELSLATGHCAVQESTSVPR